MSALNPDGRRRLVNDALKRSRFRPQDPGEIDKLMNRFATVRSAVYANCKPVYEAQAVKGSVDKKALIHLVTKQYVDYLNSFDKDELVYILALNFSKDTLDDLANLEDV